MHIGITMFPAPDAIDVRQLAQLAEERGFHSLWFPDHTHIPVQQVTPWPGNPAQPIPVYYGQILDVFIAMTAAALVTTQLRIGSAICILPQRDTIITAKQLASIDKLSGGRVLFGVGAGWNPEEMLNHRVKFSTRYPQMEDQILALKAIWQSTEAEYHGKYVDFDPINCGPRPNQAGGPRVLIGGEGEVAIDRVLRCADGWLPRYAFIGKEPLKERIARFRSRCIAAGRGHLPVSLLVGDAATSGEEHAAAGVDELIVRIQPDGTEAVSQTLDQIARRMSPWLDPAYGDAKIED